MLNAGMISSNTDLWETPQDFFDMLNAEFAFECDVCALPENAKCAKYYTPEQDGLCQEWRGACWMNPPYGRQIGAWMKKAYEESVHGGATVVCLIPARTDTAWWHEYAMKGEVRFIRGRLKFGRAKNSAPFPSAVVVFRGCKERLTMQDRSKPTAAQIDYARKLLQEAGYDRYDVLDLYGKDFDALTRGEMARLIDDMRKELGYE